MNWLKRVLGFREPEKHPDTDALNILKEAGVKVEALTSDTL